MAHSPHRSYRGCAMCKPWKRRGVGQASRYGEGRMPPREMRKLGKTRRLSRGYVGE